MLKNIMLFLLAFMSFKSMAQFAPPAGQAGSTAINRDSSAFVAWATGCKVTRGYKDISIPDSGYASVGDTAQALGKADGAPVSLGDGGSAILSFANPVINGPGYDFAVFENSFDGVFLELAFVEVSSDGINYFRFPATSNTQDTIQTSGFGATDATLINNLAGKYKVFYGTPFDLDELANAPDLDINNITHVKIIDVVGCIQNTYATYDKNGHKINDPWKTPFASGGFDLDAVGVIHQNANAVADEIFNQLRLSVYPNPVNNSGVIQYFIANPSTTKIVITDLTGKEIFASPLNFEGQGAHSLSFNQLNLNNGVYLLQLITDEGIRTKKIIVSND